MKNHFKKGMVLLIISTMLMGLMACEGKENTKESSVNREANDNSGEIIAVTFGRAITASNPKFPDSDTYEDNAYTRYAEKKLNIDITDAFEASGDDYERQVSLAIASGELPDIIRVSKDELDELVENDLVADLSGVYEEYASKYINGVYDSYEGRVLEAATYDGKLMALPGANVDSAPNMVWVRQDWLDKCKLKVDEDGNGSISINELKKIATIFKEQDPSGTSKMVPIAFSPGLNSADNHASFAMNAIAASYNAFPQQWLKDESGNVMYGSTTAEFKETLSLLADWFKLGILDPQYGTRTWDDVQALVVAGETGIVFGPWHIPDWCLNNVKAMYAAAEFTPFAIESENGKVNAFHANSNNNGFMVVRKDFKHPEVLVELENLFYDELQTSKTLETDAPEVFNYIQNAVDGSSKPWQVEVLASTSLLDDYDEYSSCIDGKLDISQLSRLESKAIVEAVNKYVADPATDDMNAWARYHSRMKGVALIKKLTQEDAFNWVSPIYPSTTETMKTNLANLNKLEEEFIVGFITGSKSLDDFDKFVSDWESQGGMQIKEEVKGALQ